MKKKPVKRAKRKARSLKELTERLIAERKRDMQGKRAEVYNFAWVQTPTDIRSTTTKAR
jgi:hypothetical protein